jgi:hypothetical protein
MNIIKRLSLMLAAGAVLVPAASSRASTMVHGSICRPSSDNGNAQGYTALTLGFETSVNMDISCAAPVDNVPVQNPVWRFLLQKPSAASMTCTGNILNLNGELVASSSGTVAAAGEAFLGGQFVAPQSNLYAYGFRCVNAPPVRIEAIRVF